MSTPSRHTSLYHEHLRLGARMVDFAGFELPIQYTGVKAEHNAVRESLGVFDVSHMGELRVVGPGALRAVNRLITNDLESIGDGKALYSFCCNEQGGILDDLILYRISEQEIFIVCNASNRNKISAHFEHQLRDSGCAFRDESDFTALIAVQGPRAMAQIELLTQAQDLGQMPSFSFREAQVAGITCQVARTGYTGEDGVEIFCAWDDAPQVFRAVLAGDAAHSSGSSAAVATPAGLAARDTLRLEARLLLYGNDIDETCNPFETGFGWVVKLNKEDFIGKSALERLRAAGPARKLVGFEMKGRGIARSGYTLFDDQEIAVGHVTSGSPSPSLGTAIGLGYVPAERSDVGRTLYVDCRGKLIEAEIVKTPFYHRPR